MRIKSSVLFIIIALVVLAGMSAQAAVVVTPVAGSATQLTNGWSTWSYNMGYGELCTWGPPTYENDSSTPFMIGRGAFYAETDMYKGTAPDATGDKSPSTVWIGTDTWKGAPVAGRTLGSITAMEYYSWVAQSPDRFGDGAVPINEAGYWNKTDYWRYCQQPITLELTIESPDGTDVRQIWCRPWGYNFTGDDLPRAHLNKWERINCMLLKWYMPEGDVPADADATEMGWYTWAEVLNHQLAGPPSGIPAFRDWKLIATNEAPFIGSGLFGRGGGWKNALWGGHQYYSNGTGKAINFRIGARFSKVTHLFLQGSQLWASADNGFRGCIDNFTLGFNGQSETYDLEPAQTTPTPRVVATSMKAARNRIMGSIVKTVPPSVTDGTQRLNLFKLAGKVIAVHNGVGKNDYFSFDDGSGMTYTERWKDPVTLNWVEKVTPCGTWIFLDPPTAGDPRVNDYISAYGFFEPLRFAPANTPPVLWTAPIHINNHSY